MPTPLRHQKAAPPLMTGQEALYLRFLSEKQVPVNVKLRDGEVVHGWVEYYDDCMIRLTREGKPNLFIYKQQIRTISELVRKDEARRRVAMRKEEAALQSKQISVKQHASGDSNGSGIDHAQAPDTSEESAQ